MTLGRCADAPTRFPAVILALVKFHDNMITRASGAAFTNRSGIAAALLPGQQLQGVPLDLHGVVPGHSSAVLEAEDLLQA